MSKSCGTCTKCCDGWLMANIKGHSMYPGKPCYFVEIGKGCTIYEDRPENPCKNFSCAWLDIEEMPDEFKPENSNTIMHWNSRYWAISKAPNEPTPEFLSWAIDYVKSKNQNMLWYIDNKGYWHGDEQFCKDMEKMHGG